MSGTKRSLRAFIAVGSNLGARVSNCKRAVSMVDESPGVDCLSRSSLYETAPVGINSQRPFVNGVFEVRTTLGPLDLLDVLLEVEKQMGRDRSQGPDRVIDLDLLNMEGVTRQPDERSDLELPHPRLADRDFVLVPWAEIAPDVVVEGLGKTVRELLECLSSLESVIRKVEEL
ncbi:MAG: 2-amino-4-hydroxy-6-hydroxymethyldihydropteridine diphosphokinase [Thermodesulfobacteria bacterium]|nr:2-amino-4-hydroxy-6-hydroxymethyldihydropteridine diphosphokinase [Thermodesulfobacteriota bacterium]